MSDYPVYTWYAPLPGGDLRCTIRTGLAVTAPRPGARVERYMMYLRIGGGAAHGGVLQYGDLDREVRGPRVHIQGPGVPGGRAWRACVRHWASGMRWAVQKSAGHLLDLPQINRAGSNQGGEWPAAPTWLGRTLSPPLPRAPDNGKLLHRCLHQPPLNSSPNSPRHVAVVAAVAWPRRYSARSGLPPGPCGYTTAPCRVPHWARG